MIFLDAFASTLRAGALSIYRDTAAWRDLRCVNLYLHNASIALPINAELGLPCIHLVRWNAACSAIFRLLDP